VKRIKTKLSPSTYSLFCSLFLGHSEGQEPKEQIFRDYFGYWGISHYLARSGLHVAIILVILQLMMRFIPFRFAFKQLIFALILAIFALLSWSSISFTRVLVAYFVSKIYLFFGVYVQPLHLVFLACFILLAYNPLHLFFLNFQLTFTFTLGLTLLHEMGLNKRHLNECSRKPA
jgi:competence protein ComEC